MTTHISRQLASESRRKFLQTGGALVVTLTLVLMAGGGLALWSMGGEFLPEMRENHFTIHMRGVPGTSLPESLEAGRRITRSV